ncbi:DUF5330 domain-containing protein [Shinella daejeonensis]|uniref:DUF5330 domain-containing protein n=1 Tax=Shinella daejeonensis TaxID=659017 RepID=UPI0020C78042|nr:DUF5330 domain-containing protein [Shinella daejeonensis]MCP8897047.1 DUF5330 domain-containing protein [Shinella daejeonensis]
MWFLIKGTFWFSLVLVLLPFLNAESSAKLERGPAVEIGDTLTAASEAVHYLTALCLEKPDVCRKGSETFVALGHRAREGALIAYQFLDHQFADEDTVTATAEAEATRTEALDQPLPETASAVIEADRLVTGTIAIPTRRPDRNG